MNVAKHWHVAGEVFAISDCLVLLYFVLTNYSWFQIDEHAPGNVFSSSRLTEEGVEGVISASDCLVTGHLSVGLDTMLQTVQLPAGIAHLDSGLADMDGDTFAL